MRGRIFAGVGKLVTLHQGRTRRGMDWAALIAAFVVLSWPFADPAMAARPPGTGGHPVQDSGDVAAECVAELNTTYASLEAKLGEVVALRRAGKVGEADALESGLADLKHQVVLSGTLLKEAGAAAQKASEAFSQGRVEDGGAYADFAIAAAGRLRTEGLGACASAGTQLLRLSLTLRALLAGSTSQWDAELADRQRVLEMARAEGRQDWEAEALIDLAGPLGATGEYQTALERLEEAERLLGRTGQTIQLLQVLQQRSAIYALTGRLSEAAQAGVESLSVVDQLLAREEEHSEHERAYLRKKRVEILLALAQNQMWAPVDCTDAKAEVERLLELLKADVKLLQDPRYYALVLNLEAAAAGVFDGDYARALEKLERGWELYQDHERRPGQVRLVEQEAENLGLLSHAAASAGQIDKAQSYAQQGLDRARGLESPIAKEGVLTALGRALYLAGDYDRAEAVLREGLGIWSDLRAQFPEGTPERAAMSVMFFDSYEVLQAIALARQDIEGALRIAEELRGNPLVAGNHLEAQSSAGREPSFDPVAVARAWNATIVVYGLLPDFRQWVLPGKLQGLQRGLDKTLLIWVIDPDDGIRFQQVDLTAGFSPDTPSSIPWSKPKQGCAAGIRLLDYINKTHASVVAKDIAKQERRELHRLLIEPIADLLRGDVDRTVVLMPYGPLYQVPFAALEDSQGRWLIKRHTISLSPSIALLDRLAQRSSGERGPRSVDAGQALVVGIGEFQGFNDNRLAPLPNAVKEARLVANHFGVKPVLSDRATKDTVLSMLPEAQVVHLATHASYELPEANNVLFLANGERLTTHDIAKRDLNTELVALNACRSVGGRITAEGVVGMASAFLSAGAKRTLVSIWDVVDPEEKKADLPPQPLFAQALYDSYAETGSWARALRDAMLVVAEHYPNPRIWGGFTLIGAPD